MSYRLPESGTSPLPDGVMWCQSLIKAEPGDESQDVRRKSRRPKEGEDAAAMMLGKNDREKSERGNTVIIITKWTPRSHVHVCVCLGGGKKKKFCLPPSPPAHFHLRNFSNFAAATKTEFLVDMPFKI